MRNLLIASLAGEQLVIPFTIKQFFQVFEKYNQAIFPMQFVLTLGAAATMGTAVIVQHNLTLKTTQAS